MKPTTAWPMLMAARGAAPAALLLDLLSLAAIAMLGILARTLRAGPRAGAPEPEQPPGGYT